MFSFFSCSKSVSQENLKSLHDFKAEIYQWRYFRFFKFKRKKVLIVNTASYCGLTYQYQDLESLYKEYKKYGFEIIAFPANNFGKQEPGSDEEIASFCDSKYATSFILMSKIDVKGKNIHPIYEWLTKKELNGVKNSTVRWNFQKYISDQNGKSVDYFFPIQTLNQINNKDKEKINTKTIF